MSNNIYKIKYDFEIGDFTKKELNETGSGGCDAVILHSILFDESGASSYCIIDKDGRTNKPLPSMEVFKAWVMMASELGDDEDLPEHERQFCRDVVESIRSVILGGK